MCVDVDEAGDDVHSGGVDDAACVGFGDFGFDSGDDPACDGEVHLSVDVVCGVDHVAAFD